MLVREGGVEIEVPEARDGASEGSGDGVFFNPTQELNRDVTVAVLRAFSEREPRAETYLDAMAASGIRGVRAAAAGYDVTCADVDPDAVALAESNLARNDLDGRVVHRDANALLHQEDFDVVDVDPFGSPVPFADAAFASARGLVAVTATDTAPLCGAHMNAGVRKYDAVPRNTEYHAEMGLRVLVSAMVRTAARRDVAATPVFSHVTRHYARTYLEIERKATAADAVLEALGFVYHCPECLAREHERGRIADQPETCPECGSDQVLTAGPVWLGPVVDREFVDRVAGHVTDDMGEARQARKLASSLRDELDVPTHYDQHRLCKRWGRPASSMDAFLDALRDAGFDASRAHYSGTAFKTGAGVAQIREATREVE